MEFLELVIFFLPVVDVYAVDRTTCNGTIICEGGKGNISCSDGLINIMSANYGRTTINACQPGKYFKTDCHAKPALTTVQNNCQHKGQCELHSSNTVFGDPCNGTQKYLNVSYCCIAFEDFESTTLVQMNTTIITSTLTAFEDFESTTLVQMNTTIITSTLTALDLKTTTLVQKNTTISAASLTDRVIIISVGSVAAILLVFGVVLLAFCIKRGFLQRCKKDRAIKTFSNAAYDADGNISKAGTRSRSYDDIHTYYNDVQSNTGSTNENKMSQERTSSSIYKSDTELTYIEAQYGAYDYLGKGDERRKNNVQDNIYDHSNINSYNDSMYDRSDNYRNKTQNEDSYTYNTLNIYKK